MNWHIVMTDENLEILANVKTRAETDQIVSIIEFWKRLRWPLNTVTPTNIVRTDRRDDAK